MIQASEKAKELVSRFRSAIYEGVLTSANVDLKREKYRDEQGKRCALICVEEILASSDHAGGWDDYWNQVKQEILNLQP